MVRPRVDLEEGGQERVRNELGVFGRSGQDVEVVGARGETVQQLAPVEHGNRDLDVRKALGEAPEQPRREGSGAGADGDAQRTMRGRAQPGQPRVDFTQPFEDVPAGREQLPPCTGHLHAASSGLEQRDAERLGELLDLHRYGGLRHVQLLRGTREAAVARDCFEYREVRERAVPEVTPQVAVLHAWLPLPGCK